MTKYVIRLWVDFGTVTSCVVKFNSYSEAQSVFEKIQVSDTLYCVEFIKEKIYDGYVIDSETLSSKYVEHAFDCVGNDIFYLPW